MQLIGYIHKLSPIKNAFNNKRINYFDLHLQTSQANTIRVVCYSPKKRKLIQSSFERKSSIKFKATLNTKKFTNEEEYTLPTSASLELSGNLQFQFNESIINCLLYCRRSPALRHLQIH